MRPARCLPTLPACLIAGLTTAEGEKAIRAVYAPILDAGVPLFVTDVSQIVEILGIDPRIGSGGMRPGIGYGGGCLPKDIRAFTASALQPAPSPEPDWLVRGVTRYQFCVAVGCSGYPREQMDALRDELCIDEDGQRLR
ncbi:hypothetical protein [Streptomyces sp. ISL-98]|uniref:hypothetical protein n=1 Tax=Streptomyces sp. ISL-98 TaxID=2819192 RepID=UPI00203540BE|nr:hypothetical protein [Streptomyces sp. ISL-98]